jgi:hypothetical protein
MQNSITYEIFFKRFIVVLGAVIATALTGCASIVYKDAATTYVAASRDLIKAFNDASHDAAVAADATKIHVLAKDINCPIAERGLFIRKPSVLSAAVTVALDRFPETKKSYSCAQLLVCGDSGAAHCRNACLTRDEGNCLSQIEQNLVISKKALAESAKDDDLRNATEAFHRVIEQVQVGKINISSTDLAALGLKVYSEYLDQLGKLAEKDTSDLETRATALSKRLGDRVKNYEDIMGKTLSTGAKEEQKAVGEYLGALSKLAADIQVLAKNAEGVDQIKRLVNENEPVVQLATLTIQKIVRMETTAATVYSNQSAKAARMNLQAKFAGTSNEYDRMMIYNEVAKYPIAQYEVGEAAINVTFKALDESHANLVQLIRSPNDEQLKKIRNEKFQSFKTIAGDVIAVGKLFL